MRKAPQAVEWSGHVVGRCGLGGGSADAAVDAFAATRREFVLGAFLDAAAAVTATAVGECYRLTASLVRQSLVASAGDGRFRLLESLRLYAAEALAELPDAAEVHRRHLEHVVATMSDADRGLRARDQDDWLARAAAAMPDIRAALRWAFDGLRPPVQIRQIRARLHERRRRVDLGLNKDETGALALAFALLLELGARLLLDRLLPLLEDLPDEGQTRAEQERDEKEGVEVDDNQHDFPTGERRRNSWRVGAIVFEVEVHQGLS